MEVIINFFIKIINFVNIKNFKLRFVTTLILLSFFAILFFLGELVMSLFFIFLFGGILYELKINYLKVNNIYQKLQVSIIPFLLLIYLACEINILNFNVLFIDIFYLFLITAIFLSLIFFYSSNNIFYPFISFLVVFSFFSIIKILFFSKGLLIVFFLVTLVSSMDIFAYIGGNVFGKNKIAPNISYGKTIEGTIVGLFFTILISICIKDIVSLNLFQSIYLGAIVGFLAFLGDLIESSFKRKVGVKDSGNIIPGHGGLLDRFDGYILVTPFAFIFLIF